LHIVHAIRSDAFAGVERHVVTVALGQAQRGHDVTVIGGDRAMMREHLGSARQNEIAWMPAASTAAAARALLNRRFASVINVHMTAAELAAVLTKPLMKAPVVSTRHFGGSRGNGVPAKIGGRVVARMLAAQIAISRYVADRVEGECVVVAPGVSAVDDAPPATGRERVVLMAQRLEPEKRTEAGLRAFAASGLPRQGWRMEIAGDGSERGRLKSLAADLGVSDMCTFLGRHPDPSALLLRASMLLAPCPIDGFGLSVVEGMAARLPVIAAAGGGHLETVGSVHDAALYPPDDLAAAAGLLAEMGADPARRDAYGAALQNVQRRQFTVDRQVDATLDVYQRVLR
jgi:glycosyltransferase involved in cell wall biosynthesis